MPFCFKFVFEVPSNIWLNLLLQKDKENFYGIRFLTCESKSKKDVGFFVEKYSNIN